MISAAKDLMESNPVKTGPFCLEGLAGSGPFFRLGYGEDGPPRFEKAVDGGGTLWLPAESSRGLDPLVLMAGQSEPARSGPVRYWADGDSMAGYALVPIAPGSLARASGELYANLFAVARGYNLCRIWNWVPGINDSGTGDPEQEHYRQYCLGRSRAFTAAFGDQSERSMPAGTAVGLRGDTLAVLFAAVRAPVEHRENPQQVPAYHYPVRYGPRPPSFARASMVHPAASGGYRCLCISGTASIIVSESRFPEDLAGQLRVTVGNLRIMGVEGEGFASGKGGLRRYFRVYIRRWEERAAVQAALEDSLLRGEDHVVYVCADICRRELRVEVEAMLLMPAAL